MHRTKFPTQKTLKIQCKGTFLIHFLAISTLGNNKKTYFSHFLFPATDNSKNNKKKVNSLRDERKTFSAFYRTKKADFLSNKLCN